MKDHAPLWPVITLVASIIAMILAGSILATRQDSAAHRLLSHEHLHVFGVREGTIFLDSALHIDNQNLERAVLHIRDELVSVVGTDLHVDLVEQSDRQMIRVLMTCQPAWASARDLGPDETDWQQTPHLAAIVYSFLQPFAGFPWADSVELVLPDGEGRLRITRDALQVHSL